MVIILTNPLFIKIHFYVSKAIKLVIAQIKKKLLTVKFQWT